MADFTTGLLCFEFNSTCLYKTVHSFTNYYVFWVKRANPSLTLTLWLVKSLQCSVNLLKFSSVLILIHYRVLINHVSLIN